MEPSLPNTNDTNPLGIGYAPAGDAVSPDIYDAMRATKPWATLLGVVGLVVLGLMVIASAEILVTGHFASSSVGEAVGYLPGLLYLFPALFLVRYGRSIGAFLAAPSQVALGEALRQQKSYWRFMGITVVVAMVFAALALLVVAGISLFAAL